MSETLAIPTVTRIGDAEIYSLPSGLQVAYRDRDHSYWQNAVALTDGTARCAGRLTGVSTIVSPFDWRPDGLMKWAAFRNLIGVSALAAEGLSQDDLEDMRASLRWLTSPESIESGLFDARLHFTQTRDEAAARGTNVHKHALHALATGEPVPRRAELTDEEWGYARGVIAFWHDCEPEPIYAEQVVGDPSIGVAGRFDLTCDLTYLGVRHRALVDAKTSGYLPTKHHVQLAGYEHCSRVSGLGETEVQLILQVTPDGGYDLLPSCGTTDDFLAAVDLYRRAARIGRDFNALRKAAA